MTHTHTKKLQFWFSRFKTELKTDRQTDGGTDATDCFTLRANMMATDGEKCGQ